jgi:hypothetical protein
MVLGAGGLKGTEKDLILVKLNSVRKTWEAESAVLPRQVEEFGGEAMHVFGGRVEKPIEDLVYASELTEG